VLVGATPAHPLLFDSYVARPNVLNKAFNSTAAGRYQEKWSNWISYSKSLRLPEFGPLSQDQMALQRSASAARWRSSTSATSRKRCACAQISGPVCPVTDTASWNVRSDAKKPASLVRAQFRNSVFSFQISLCEILGSG
jgi:hypothetical protein